MSARVISGDVSADHVASVLFVSFLHYKVICPLVMNKYLMGRYFETVQISYFSLRHDPLILTPLMILA